MRKILLLLTLCVLLLMVACITKVKPLDTMKIKHNIISASYDPYNNRIAILTKEMVCIIPLPYLTEEYDKYRINLEYNKIFCLKNLCWLGGGGIGKGFIKSIDIFNGNIKQLNKDKCSEIYAVISAENILATGHADGEIVIWDALSGNKKLKFGEYNSEIFVIEIIPESNMLYSGDGIGTIDLWNLSTGEKIKSNKRVVNSIFSLRYDRQTNTVLGGGSDGILCIFDGTDLSIDKKINLNSGAILSCDISNDSKIVCGTTGGNVVIINHNGTNQRTSKLHKSDVLYVKFINNGNIVSVSKDGEIKIWDSECLEKQWK